MRELCVSSRAVTSGDGRYGGIDLSYIGLPAGDDRRNGYKARLERRYEAADDTRIRLHETFKNESKEWSVPFEWLHLKAIQLVFAASAATRDDIVTAMIRLSW